MRPDPWVTAPLGTAPWVTAPAADPPSAREVDRALSRAGRGARIDVAEATALLAARDGQLRELMAIAARVRDLGLADAGRPGVITWSPKVFVPLTRLCRDRCHYCTFATDPAALRRSDEPLYLEPDDVLAIARAGAAAGCTEALFTLGDRPEDRWPAARQWLEQRGYDSTLGYLRAMAILVLEQTGLLPHLNPGVLSWAEIARLRPVAASMGLMLETASPRLCEPGQVHHGSPDKDPAVRLGVLRDAGRHRVPMTTGVLVGIGETPGERAQALFALRAAADEHGAVQEVIVQNFRAKEGTPLEAAPDLPRDEHLAAVAVARLVLGPGMRVQAPPNLAEADGLADLIGAGIDDWGGVSPLTPDHVNPERPWPAPDALAAATASAGFRLVARLPVHPPYVLGEGWLDPMVSGHVAALAGPDGLAVEPRRPVGRPWQVPADVMGRPGSGSAAHVPGPRQAVPGAGRPATGCAGPGRPSGGLPDRWPASGVPPVPPVPAVGVPPARRPLQHLDPRVRSALLLAGGRPGALLEQAHEESAVALLSSTGAELEALCALADDVRRDAVGDDVTFVVNRNINFTNVCYTGCRFCAFARRATDAAAQRLDLDEVARRTREAAAAGATEICMQGGIDPHLPVDWYWDLARTVKSAVPGIHLHAFSPMEVASRAHRSGIPVREWLVAAREAGVDSIPGTAAEILDDEVRWILTRGKLPTSAWVEVVTTAHALGIPSTATMMYGHVDAPVHWIRHLRVIAGIQRETGGFTEFVPLPFVHSSAPIYLSGDARPGPTVAQDRAVHAVARLALHGLVDHIQGSWVKLGDSGMVSVLRGGADDLGGTLMEESISRSAGAGHGSNRSVAELAGIAAAAGRQLRQRTTTYAPVVGGARAGVLPG